MLLVHFFTCEHVSDWYQNQKNNSILFVFLPECPGWHYINGKCYYFSENGYNFSEAKLLCQENGAKIFEPKNQKINKMVHDVGKKGYWYWIGIIRLSAFTKEDWIWIR